MSDLTREESIEAHIRNKLEGSKNRKLDILEFLLLFIIKSSSTVSEFLILLLQLLSPLEDHDK